MIRWEATVYYRSENGSVDVVHDLEELEDIHDLVEAAPHWDTIENIEILRVNHSESKTLTIEEAMKL